MRKNDSVQIGKRLVGQGNIAGTASLPAWVWDMAKEKGDGKPSRGITIVFQEYLELRDGLKDDLPF